MTTIHQPNSQITRCFDDLLLIARGQIVYTGEMQHAVTYFDGLGYACAPPPACMLQQACSGLGAQQ